MPGHRRFAAEDELEKTLSNKTVFNKGVHMGHPRLAMSGLQVAGSISLLIYSFFVTSCASYKQLTPTPETNLRMPIGELPTRYTYIPLGTAMGEHCDSHFRKPGERGSLLEAMQDAMDSKGADMLANPVIEHMSKNYFFLYYRDCTRVLGTALKIETPREPKLEGLSGKANQGSIIGLGSGKAIGGKFDEVLINRGKLQGVAVGDKFAVRKNRTSPNRLNAPDIGREIIGYLKVATVTENSAKAVISTAYDGVVEGDFVESVNEK